MVKKKGIPREDIERLIRACNRVEEALNPEPSNVVVKFVRDIFNPSEGTAATVLCKELTWFVHERESFWQRLGDAHEILSERENSEAQSELLRKLEELLELESTVFQRLGFSNEKSSSVISHAFDALTLLQDDAQSPSAAAWRNLRNRLERAQKLVCCASRGPLEKAYDKLIGRKGLRVLAGGTIAGADITAAVLGEGGLVTCISVKVGFAAMKEGTDGLLDLLEAGGEALA